LGKVLKLRQNPEEAQVATTTMIDTTVGAQQEETKDGIVDPPAARHHHTDKPLNPNQLFLVRKVSKT